MTATVDEALLLAVAAHREGRLAEAAALYRAVLQAVPDHGDALHLLAVVRRRIDGPENATAAFARALAAVPGNAAVWRNYALLLADLGRSAAAPPSSSPLVPPLVPAFAAQRRAAILTPTDDQPWIDLGNLLVDLGRLDEAAAAYRLAVALVPERADGPINLGVALRRVDRMDQALRAAARGVRLRPADPALLGNYGNALLDCGLLTAAAAAARRGLALEPAAVPCLVNLGNVLKERGEPAQAEKHYRRALATAPERPEIGLNLGMALLQQGRFAEGWRAYENRLRQADWPHRRDCPQPEWTGGALAGRTILIHAEQGLGDTLQFVRYLPHLRRRGARVIFEPQRSLAPLLKTLAGVDALVPRGDPSPGFDVHAPLLSLPCRLGSPLPASADVPYLTADPQRLATQRRRLADRPGFKIGVAWQGNPEGLADRGRSFPARLFAPLARSPGVRLHCLQRIHGLEQLADWPDDAPLADADLPVDIDGAFVDTAAIICGLDLVITSDSALAHLAGAMGRPVWVVLQAAPEWRYQLGRTDSPWYPTMRLFRQSRPGDWESAFAAVAAALSERLATADVCDVAHRASGRA